MQVVETQTSAPLVSCTFGFVVWMPTEEERQRLKRLVTASSCVGRAQIGTSWLKIRAAHHPRAPSPDAHNARNVRLDSPEVQLSGLPAPWISLAWAIHSAPQRLLGRGTLEPTCSD
jgi:hypothetical protein